MISKPVFKLAILDDLIKYSDLHTDYVLSEESLRILLHFLFKNDIKKPKYIQKTQVEKHIKSFQQNDELMHQQYLVESGSRSAKTPRDSDSIHYAAMNLYRHGDETIISYADHYHGKSYSQHDNFQKGSLENIKIIFLGEHLYQADSNHCLIFAIHHLLLSQNDAALKELVIEYTRTENPGSFKFKMPWITLPILYNQDIQSASFYFNTYLDLLLTKPDGEALYTEMMDALSRNLINIHTQNSATALIPITSKLVNKGICFKTIAMCQFIHNEIDEFEKLFQYLIIEDNQFDRDETYPELLEMLYLDVSTLNLAALEDSFQPDHLAIIKTFLRLHEKDVHTKAKFIKMGAELLLNCYLLQIAYANNVLSYTTLTSALFENLNFYSILLTLNERQLKPYFPSMTWDIKKAINIHYSYGEIILRIKHLINTLDRIHQKLNFNLFYNHEMYELVGELLESLKGVNVASNPLVSLPVLKQCDALFDNMLMNSFQFEKREIAVIENIKLMSSELIQKLTHIQRLPSSLQHIIHTPAFAKSFVSSHPLVRFLFSHSPLVHLEQAYKAKRMCSPKGPKDQNNDEFLNFKILFSNPLFQLAVKTRFINIESLLGHIFFTTNALELRKDNMNTVYNQFKHIQLLLNHMFSGKGVSLDATDIHDILLEKKGESLRFLVVTYAFLNRDIKIKTIEEHKQKINTSRLSVVTDLDEMNAEKLDEELSRLSWCVSPSSSSSARSSSSPRFSPISVADCRSLFSRSPGPLHEILSIEQYGLK